MTGVASGILPKPYETLATPEPQRLKRIADTLNEICPYGTVGIHGYDRITGAPVGVASERWDPSHLANYFTHFAEISPWKDAHRYRRTGVSYTDEEAAPNAFETHPEFMYDWAIPSGKGAGVAIKLFDDFGHDIALSFDYPLALREKHQDELVETVSSLQTHFLQVINLGAHLSTSHSMAQSILDAEPNASFVVRGDRRVLASNARGERLISEGDLLRIGLDGALALASARSRPLGDILAEAEASTAAFIVKVEAPGRPGALLRVTRLTTALSYLGVSGPGGVYLVTVLGTGAPLDPAQLARVLDLTPSEAAVCLLLYEGASVDEIAAARGRARETVRRQLKSVFLKTGCRSQAAVVALIAQLTR